MLGDRSSCAGLPVGVYRLLIGGILMVRGIGLNWYCPDLLGWRLNRSYGRDCQSRFGYRSCYGSRNCSVRWAEWAGVGSAVTASSFVVLDRVVVLEAEVGVSGSAACAVVAAPVSFGNPGALSITEPPFTGVDIVAFVVEVEVAPVEAEYSGREYGAGKSDVS